jgi:pyrophosphatase PpaX
MNRSAVLFDLDGTLIDTTELILHCFELSWKKVYGRKLDRQRYLATIGIPLREAMRILLNEEVQDRGESESSSDTPLLEALVQEYRACNAIHHDQLAKPFSGVSSTVFELRKRGYQIGVVSSKTQELGLRGLNLFGLRGLMDDVVFLEDSVRHKPDPEPLLLALQRFGISEKQAAYVGDSRHDMQAGKAAGIRTVAALWGPIPRKELEREKPDQLAATPSQLLEIFP